MSTPSSPDPSYSNEPDEPETWKQESRAEEPAAPWGATPSSAPVEPDTGTLTSPYDEPYETDGAGPALADGAPTAPVEAEAAAGRPADASQPADAGRPPADPALTDQAPAAAPATAPDGATSAISADTAARQHRAERPVPRSGLAEHHSAAYLTGERAPEPPPAPATAPASAPSPNHFAGDPAAAGPQPSWVTGAAAPPVPGQAPAPAATGWTPNEDRGPDTAVILEGASVTPTVRSRAGAHWLGILLSLVLLPIAWYLLADAGARLTLPTGSPWESGNLNIAAILELVGGLVVLAVALLSARWSSVGSIIAGSLVVILGVPFVAVPAWTQEFLTTATEWLHRFNDLGANIAHHLETTGSTGRFIVYGLALILIGVISHGARRQGRREALAGARVGRG